MKGTDSLLTMDVEVLGFSKRLVDATRVHRLKALGKTVMTEVVALL